jgi:WD40 repeat protein
MSRLVLALCVAAVLAAPEAGAAERPVLVPEGEPEQLLQQADWMLMGSVGALAFSPDGLLLASGDSDGTIHLWEVATGREVHRLEGHDGAVHTLAFSQDGDSLVSGGKDTLVRMWEVREGRELHRLDGHKDLVRSVAISPNGKWVASGGSDKTVRLWDAKKGSIQTTLEGPEDPVLSFTSNDRLQISGEKGSYAREWDLRTGTEVSQGTAKSLQDPDAKGAPPSPEKGSAPAQQLDVLTQRGTPQASQDVVDPLTVYSPDGRLMATGGNDHTVRLREPGGRVLRTFEGHTAPVEALAFSPDGRTLASGGRDNTVRLWDIATGYKWPRLEGNRAPVGAVAFSPDGRTLISGGSDALLHLWAPDTGSELRRLEGHMGFVRSVATSADGRLLASGGDDGFVYLWEPGTGHQPRRLTGHTGAVQSVAFSPDGSMVASGGSDKAVRLWRTGNGQPQQRLEKHTGTVRSVAFSADRRTLASAGDDGVIFLWEPGLGDLPRHRLAEHKGPVRSVAFSPDGQVLASGGDDKLVMLWEVRTGKRLAVLKGHTKDVYAVAFSSDRRTLASGGGDKKVLLWKVGDSNTLIYTVPLGPEEKPLQWKVGDTRPQRVLEGHTGWVTSLAFTSDGLGLASGDDAGVVRLWSPQEEPPARGLLRGARQGWLSHLTGQPVFRHDDGSFLSRLRKGGEVAPLPPPPGEPPRLAITRHELRREPGDFGELGELVLTVSNEAGAGRAYWIRVQAVKLPPGLVLLTPPPEPRLEAGSSVELRVGLSYLRPAKAPMPDQPQLHLQLVDAAGAKFPAEAAVIPVPLRTPELKLVGAPQFEGKTVTVTLRNEGTQGTGEFLLIAELEGKSHKGGKQPPPSLYPRENLEPGEEWQLAITPPPSLLDEGRFALRLAAQYQRWPRTWSEQTTPIKMPWPYAQLLALGFGAIVLIAVGLGYHARVYRNPVVMQVRKSPFALKSYPLMEMVRTDEALRRARCLDLTITAAGIPRTRWERVLRGAAPAPHEAALALAEAVGGRLGAPLASGSWALTLPPLRLRFARDTAVIVADGTRLESGEAERAMADVFQDGRGPSQVIVVDRTQAQNVRQALEGVPRMRCIILSADRLRDLLLVEEPVRLLETTIAEQIAVSELSPYQVAGGVKLENLFFGREREIRAIADRSLRNFLVVGQRQMGKSSLLLAVLRRLQARPGLDARYVELADADVHRRLARERERVPADGSPLPPFVEVAAGEPSRPRVWLIDEADDFIAADARAGHPVLQAMRALAEEGRAYFILAGFWELYRAVVLDEKQPLRNFGEHLRLEPLDERAALALVTEPMEALGLRWDAPSTTTYLLEQAGRRANLLVLACKALVESLPPDTHELTRAHLERVLREDKDLRDQGRRWRGDHPLHRAVVRQALLLGRPTREEVRQALKARGADIRATDFDEAMDHRELSYVLVPDGEGRLYCPVPLMQRYIESERGLETGLVEDLEDLRRRGLSEVPRPV